MSTEIKPVIRFDMSKESHTRTKTEDKRKTNKKSSREGIYCLPNGNLSRCPFLMENSFTSRKTLSDWPKLKKK